MRRMTPPSILLFLGGTEPDPPGPRIRADLDRVGSDVIVIAADSGLHRARRVGVPVDHLVGDLDSVDPRLLEDLGETELHRHPADKDATDAELALVLAARLVGTAAGPAAPAGRSRLLVIGGGGGRLDHVLADLTLLGSRLTEPFEVRALLGATIVSTARPGRPTHIDGDRSELVSLLPLGGEVTGVTTRGLRWPLVDATLELGSTRAISNELVEPTGEIRIASGTLLVVQPGERAAMIEPRDGPYDPSPR